MNKAKCENKMKELGVWYQLQDDLQSEYCGCNDCLEGAN